MSKTYCFVQVASEPFGGTDLKPESSTKNRIFTSLETNIYLGTNALLTSRFVCKILTHQKMTPSWVSTHKNMHAKDKPAQLCAHLPPHSQKHFQVTS